MNEVSNKTLIVLLVIAIITVLGSFGTIISKLGFGANLITGLATVQYGTVNVTVQSTAAIFMTMVNMSFSSGTLDFSGASLVNTTINSSAINVINGKSYNSFQANIPNFQYRVDGNIDVNVSFTGTTAGDFLGGTGPAFKINITNNEGGSCAYIHFNTSVAPQYNLSADVLGNPQTICNVSNFEDSTDTVNISVYLWIPSDTFTGLRNATLTLTAVAT